MTTADLPLFAPHTRHDHPDTSRQAAERVGAVVAGQRLTALRLLAQIGEATCAELAGDADSRLYRQLGRRLPELRAMRLAGNGEARRCAVLGQNAQVWRLTRAGREAVR